MEPVHTIKNHALHFDSIHMVCICQEIFNIYLLMPFDVLVGRVNPDPVIACGTDSRTDCFTFRAQYLHSF